MAIRFKLLLEIEFWKIIVHFFDKLPRMWQTSTSPSTASLKGMAKFNV